MPSPEGSRPDNLDNNPASQPRGYRDVSPPTPGAGEQPGSQEPKVQVPSYLTGISREVAESSWLEPKKDKKVLMGWDSLAEYLLDQADVLPKPNTPNIPKDDIDAIDEDNLNAHGMTADRWEEEVLFVLDATEDRHLIPEFKQHMQEYRRAVKDIVQLWRERGLL